ncbi:DMT family transporter [Planktotalea arctica]|uniref:DMT family transporter n=1 Tax=Planktotalea arctica TaxID=1481893 RepID=UPI000A1745BE|nr:DMT family transporter [Planktotalea arctica]
MSAVEGQLSSLGLKAIGLLILTILCFDAMSILVRILSASYSAQELSAYRNVLGIFPSLVLLIYTEELKFRGSSLKIEQWKLALFRGLVVAVAQIFFYSALAQLELATVATLGQTNAFFVVILSVLYLGEKVGAWRVAALVIGFAGVVWILRPGSDAFTLAALLPIGAAACYAFAMVSVRKFGPQTSNGLLYLYSSAGSAVGAIFLAMFTTEFSPIHSIADGALIFLMSTIGGIGVLLMMIAFRIASPSVLAPFWYFGILTAGLFGWLIFDEAPLDTLFPGVLLIVGAGALIIWREKRRT